VTDVIGIVLPTFIVIFIGFAIGKWTRLNMAPVVDLNLYFAVPALVFVSLLSRKIVILDAARIWAAALAVMFGCMLVAWLVFKIFRKKHSGLYVPISLMNTVNIPFPIIFLAYGAEGMVPATLFYVPNNFALYTVGILIMAGGKWKQGIREIFRQPTVYAALLGLAFNFGNVRVPQILFNAFDLLSKMCIPFVLLLLGTNLSRVNLTSLPSAFLASFLRIGVGLGLGLGAVSLLHIEGVFRSVVILDSAMPAAAMASVLATKYKNEEGLVSSVVFITTVASLVVIPVLLNWLK
jgi:predicted permease